ncbi:MAG: hypothetical protein V7K92_28830 [Nostoc sp.]
MIRAISTTGYAYAFLFILTSGLLTQGMMLSAIAQVTSDGTTNTTVNHSGNNFTILNGIEKGNNLFHSFSNFSVPNGSSATFDLITAVFMYLNHICRRGTALLCP